MPETTYRDLADLDVEQLLGLLDTNPSRQLSNSDILAELDRRKSGRIADEMRRLTRLATLFGVGSFVVSLLALTVALRASSG